MNIFEIIGLCAGILQIIGYVWYDYYVITGQIKPNTGSWVIWSYGNAIVCLNYLSLHKTISFIESLPIVCAICCVMSAIIFLVLGKFERPKWYEIVILIADIGITIYWQLSGENITTAIVLQISVLISFIPIVLETKGDPASEKAGPWMIWTVAYTLLLIAEIPQQSQLKMIYPIHYAFWHLVIFIIVIRAKPLLV